MVSIRNLGSNNLNSVRYLTVVWLFVFSLSKILWSSLCKHEFTIIYFVIHNWLISFWILPTNNPAMFVSIRSEWKLCQLLTPPKMFVGSFFALSSSPVLHLKFRRDNQINFNFITSLLVNTTVKWRDLSVGGKQLDLKHLQIFTEPLRVEWLFMARQVYLWIIHFFHMSHYKVLCIRINKSNKPFLICWNLKRLIENFQLDIKCFQKMKWDQTK